MGLILRHWSVDECAQVFDKLSRELFKAHNPSPYKIFSRFKLALDCLLNDGRYDVELFENLLKRHMGRTRGCLGLIALPSRDLRSL